MRIREQEPKQPPGRGCRAEGLGGTRGMEMGEEGGIQWVWEAPTVHMVGVWGGCFSLRTLQTLSKDAKAGRHMMCTTPGSLPTWQSLKGTGRG